jgi:hypothetical protein
MMGIGGSVGYNVGEMTATIVVVGNASWVKGMFVCASAMAVPKSSTALGWAGAQAMRRMRIEKQKYLQGLVFVVIGILLGRNETGGYFVPIAYGADYRE